MARDGIRVARAGERWPHRNGPEDIAYRQERLRGLPHFTPEDERVLRWPVPAEDLAPFLECLTAHVVLPVAVVGPLRVELGEYRLDERGALAEDGRASDEVYVPLAHSEGGLSASMLRGMRAVAQDGGVRTYVLWDRITRASCFRFASAADAVRFSRWLEGQVDAMRRWLLDPQNPLAGEQVGGVRRISRHAVLREVRTHVLGCDCHVLYAFTTGDACGPNMMTRNAYALNRWYVLERFPAETGIRPERVLLEANMGGDKKPSYLYFIDGGHGKTVVAEAFLSDATLRRFLHVSADDLVALEHVGLHGSHASGMQSVAFTPASAIAAIFAATGQDLGMVGTSSMAHGMVRRVPGGVVFTLRLPGLEVATVGGGTGMPHARSFLRLMGCLGPGKVYRFAQIVAAATLCLEISASAAMATDLSSNFYEAHLERGGLRG